MENYLDIMIESLQKKLQVLNRIIDLNQQQKILVQDNDLGPEQMEKNVATKGELIAQLNQLDEGFEQLFARVKETLEQNKSQYAEEIHTMQNLIREITDKSATIQTQELRNKELMQNKFATVRKQVKGVRKSQKVVHQYYKDMMNHRDGSSSRFLDNKK